MLIVHQEAYPQERKVDGAATCYHACMAFHSIRRILPSSLRGAGIERQVTASQVVEAAGLSLLRLWGAERATYAEPVSFQDGQLKMAARAPVAMQELRVWSVQLQNETNRSLGSRVVRSLRFIERYD